MKVRISDMMDCINDDSVSIQGNEIASIDRIKELTMRRIEKESNVTSLKPRKISRVGIIVAVLVVSMLFTGSVFAYITWEGYANTSEMSESEKEFFLKDSIAVAGELVDSEGNVHYLDASGKETMVLSKEEAAAYEKERLENMEKEVQESTQLVDVGTLSSVPNGITEVQVNKVGRFDDFALGNGHMVILTPEETAHYLLKKGNRVIISLEANDECYVECGVINEGKVIETKTEKNQYHEYSFEITEEGNYNFYVMYYSVDKSIFTKCVIDIK